MQHLHTCIQRQLQCVSMKTQLADKTDITFSHIANQPPYPFTHNRLSSKTKKEKNRTRNRHIIYWQQSVTRKSSKHFSQPEHMLFLQKRTGKLYHQ